MQIDEAALMSIKSLNLLGKGIFVFDMGEQVRLLDVIIRMQEVLQTYSPIAITGLRQGEKTRETTQNSDEVLEPTNYKDIATTQLSKSVYDENIVDKIKQRSKEDLLDYIKQKTH